MKTPKVCPVCGEETAADRFCPNDGAELIDPQDPRVRARGMICPTCRTGHPADATVCRNDGTKLVLYAVYDAQQKRAGDAKKTCPKCGQSFDANVAFCPEDGTKL